ncbi:hypothetical protein HNY73_017088 [Argiope bruennichi]|uniref:Uncharacterized protein n=1 Tax=Argiope bruennichi TaxID=94029 RepID=A0A8T0EKR5_ARGBR|nr:hypothetical protein HNY73_017088 [Argiope bruennichi]
MVTAYLYNSAESSELRKSPEGHYRRKQVLRNRNLRVRREKLKKDEENFDAIYCFVQEKIDFDK